MTVVQISKQETKFRSDLEAEAYLAVALPLKMVHSHNEDGSLFYAQLKFGSDL
jgi:hypothetical protein